MDVRATGSMQLVLLAALTITVAACGGGTSGPLGPSTGTFETNGTIPGGDGGGQFHDVDPLSLQGGVLGTFVAGSEQFRIWIRDSIVAQQLMDAHAGTGPAITSICTIVVPGSGHGAHNEPWQWSVPNWAFPDFSGFCPGCAAGWSLPSIIDNNIRAGAQYNCKPALGKPNELSLPPPGPTHYRAFLQVSLVNAQDFR